MSTDNVSSKKVKLDQPSYWKSLQGADDGPGFYAWVKLHDYWWGTGSAGASDMNRAHACNIEEPARVIEATEVWEELPALARSQGRIFVRKEYELIYKTLAEQSSSAAGFNEYLGALVIGQPGIGKSCFAIYALLRRMAEGKRVLFSISGLTYLLDDSGVKCARTSVIMLPELPNVGISGQPSPVWHLIEPGISTEDQPPFRTNIVFPILVSSPAEWRWKKWRNQGGVLRIVSDPWDVSEIAFLLNTPGLVHSPRGQRKKTLEEVENIVDEVGPCPRDVIEYLKNPKSLQYDITIACENLTSADKIFSLFYVTRLDSPRLDMSTGSHKLLLVRRQRNQDEPDDSTVISFKSAQIARRVSWERRELVHKDAKLLFEHAQRYSHGRTLAGWTFERLAIDYTSGQWPAVQPHVVDELAHMTRILGPGIRFSHCKAANIRAPLSSLEIGEDDTRSFTAPSNLRDGVIEVEQSASAIRLPIKRRTITPYSNISSVQLSDKSYFCPTQPNHPFFDSFFLEITADKTLVWVLQMTIAEKHGSAPKGFQRLRILKQRLEQQFTRPVEMKYVLVVPLKDQHIVQWKMVKEWNEIPGDVYVQYLDLSPFSFDYAQYFEEEH